MVTCACVRIKMFDVVFSLVIQALLGGGGGGAVVPPRTGSPREAVHLGRVHNIFF